MGQLDLSTWQPRARRTDPDSSHEAADRAERSGAIRKQIIQVLDLVKAFPGLTSKQLAVVGHIDRYIPARRLVELERMGLVFRGNRPGQIQWYPTRRLV